MGVYIFYAIIAILVVLTIKYHNKIKGDVIIMWYIGVIVVIGIILTIFKYLKPLVGG